VPAVGVGWAATLVGMDMHSAFELEVLGWINSDYEAPHTIARDISREAGENATENDVRAALLALSKSGRAQAYLYDEEVQCYKPVSHSEAAKADVPWFKAIEK